MNKAPLPIKDYPDLAKVMNMIQFHTKMVDATEELLRETSDVSILWSVFVFLNQLLAFLFLTVSIDPLNSFYPRLFEKMFCQNIDETTMKRYLMAFPSVCSSFHWCGHPLCPEEVSVDFINCANQATDELLTSSNLLR